MPGLDPSAGVGGVMPDEGGGQQAGLSSVLQQIMMKNYIQSALLGLAAPTWGGAGNAVYNAAANAATTDAAGSEAIGKESVRQAESAQSAQLAREQMASHEKVAEITGASREQAAEIRGKYSVDRAHIALGKASPNVANAYRESARKALGVDTNPTLMTMDPISRSQMIEQKAAEFYQNDLDRGMVPGAAGKGGTPAAAPAGAKTPTETGEDDSGGGVVPEKKPAAGAKGGPVDLGKMMSDPTHGAQFRSLMNTPQGQAKILSMNPALKPQIDAYNKDTANKKAMQQNTIPGAGVGIQ